MRAIPEETDASEETAYTSSLRERVRKLTFRCQVLAVVAAASIAGHIGAVFKLLSYMSYMNRW